ncbi:MAG TPA: hypothetical protein PK876_05275 [Elusimicrobiota bacterium]|nr:hypothetical protein [Elusimicrobiota bacterium]
MTMKRFLTLMTTLCILAPSVLASQTERPMFVRGIRPMGMGGAFTAVADDQNVFYYNPAGIVQRTGSQFTLLELSAIVGQDLLDLVDFMDKNQDKLEDFDKLSATEQAALINDIDRTISKLNPHIGVGVPNMNYLSGPIGGSVYWGTGLFGQLDGRFRINTGLVPNIDYDVNADAMVPITLGYKIKDMGRVPGKLGIGVNLKYLKRYRIKEDRVSVLQLENISDPEAQIGNAKGMDLGFLYQPTSRLNLALTSLDFLGTSITYDAIEAKNGFTAKPEETTGIRARWNMGVAWVPPHMAERLVLAADVYDFLNAQNKVMFGDSFIPDTAWTHVHVGAEYRWWFLRFRGGANQGYPTFGLGLDLPMLKVDYAYFTDELGRFAGQIPERNHMISVAFRWGAGKTEARDRIKNRKSGAQSSAAPAAENTTTAEPETETVTTPPASTPEAPAATTPPAVPSPTVTTPAVPAETTPEAASAEKKETTAAETSSPTEKKAPAETSAPADKKAQ